MSDDHCSRAGEIYTELMDAKEVEKLKNDAMTGLRIPASKFPGSTGVEHTDRVTSKQIPLECWVNVIEAYISIMIGKCTDRYDAFKCTAHLRLVCSGMYAACQEAVVRRRDVPASARFFEDHNYASVAKLIAHDYYNWKLHVLMPAATHYWSLTRQLFLRALVHRLDENGARGLVRFIATNTKPAPTMTGPRLLDDMMIPASLGAPYAPYPRLEDLTTVFDAVKDEDSRGVIALAIFSRDNRMKVIESAHPRYYEFMYSNKWAIGLDENEFARVFETTTCAETASMLIKRIKPSRPVRFYARKFDLEEFRAMVQTALDRELKIDPVSTLYNLLRARPSAKGETLITNMLQTTEYAKLTETSCSFTRFRILFELAWDDASDLDRVIAGPTRTACRDMHLLLGDMNHLISRLQRMSRLAELHADFHWAISTLAYLKKDDDNREYVTMYDVKDRLRLWFTQTRRVMCEVCMSYVPSFH